MRMIMKRRRKKIMIMKRKIIRIRISILNKC